MEKHYALWSSEALLATLGACLLAFGWRAFSAPRRGAFATLLLLPFLKTAETSGVWLRFAPVDAITFLTAAGTVVALGRGRGGDWREVRIPTAVVRGLVVFFAFVLLSMLRTESPERSVIEIATYLANVVLMILIVWHVRTREDLHRCLGAWEIATAIAVAGGVVGTFLLFRGNLSTPLTNGPLLVSTFKKSGQFAAYLLPSLPILWYQLVHRSGSRRARWLRGALLLAAVAVLPATGSRSGFLLGAAVLAFLFGGRWLAGCLVERPLVKLAALALVLGIGAETLRTEARDWPLPFRRAVSISLAEDASLRALSPARYHQWQGWRIAATEHPFTGVGAGDFRTRITSYVPAAWRSHELHSTWLGVWAEAGVLALAALLVFCLSVLRAGWGTVTRAEDPSLVALVLALTVSAVAILAYGATHFGLRMRYLWAIFGLILAAWNVAGLDADVRTAARARTA